MEEYFGVGCFMMRHVWIVRDIYKGDLWYVGLCWSILGLNCLGICEYFGCGWISLSMFDFFKCVIGNISLNSLMFWFFVFFEDCWTYYLSIYGCISRRVPCLMTFRFNLCCHSLLMDLMNLMNRTITMAFNLLQRPWKQYIITLNLYLGKDKTVSTLFLF